VGQLFSVDKQNNNISKPRSGFNWLPHCTRLQALNAIRFIKIIRTDLVLVMVNPLVTLAHVVINVAKLVVGIHVV